MADYYPNTQVDDEDSILTLIRGNRSEEEEEETKTEKGSPDTGNVVVEDDTGNIVVEQSSDITSNTTAQDATCLNDVVASLISKANTFGRNTKFSSPSFAKDDGKGV
jgi:hypothetical protein